MMLVADEILSSQMSLAKGQLLEAIEIGRRLNTAMMSARNPTFTTYTNFFHELHRVSCHIEQAKNYIAGLQALSYAVMRLAAKQQEEEASDGNDGELSA